MDPLNFEYMIICITMIISQRLGQAPASKIVFRTVKEGKGVEKLSSVYDVYKDFKLLMELDLVKR